MKKRNAEQSQREQNEIDGNAKTRGILGAATRSLAIIIVRNLQWQSADDLAEGFTHR